MAKLTILGSASATPDLSGREHTYMVLQGDSGKAILIDCAGSPLNRLQRAGVEFGQLNDVILTHFHPDHTYGFSILLMGMWLLGRRTPLRVYGLDHCLDRTEKLMSFYDWEEWPDFFDVAFHQLTKNEGAHVLDNDDFRITAAPVRHFVPTVGLRILVKASNTTVVYSSDTAPCQEMVRLAHEADILVHEAAGEGAGHSSAAQAGGIASGAGVGRLVLVHYELHNGGDDLVSQAATRFDGPIELADDYSVLDI